MTCVSNEKVLPIDNNKGGEFVVGHTVQVKGEKRTQGESPELVSNVECINRYPLIKLYIGTEQEMRALETQFEEGEWSPFDSACAEIKKSPSKAMKRKDNLNGGEAKDKEDGVSKKRKTEWQRR